MTNELEKAKTRKTAFIKFLKQHKGTPIVRQAGYSVFIDFPGNSIEMRKCRTMLEASKYTRKYKRWIINKEKNKEKSYKVCLKLSKSVVGYLKGVSRNYKSSTVDKAVKESPGYKNKYGVLK